MWLIVAFIAIPLIEIALFIQVGGLIGLWPTLGIVLLTAVAGSFLMRSQGLATLERLRGSLSRMDDPSEPLAHGAMILFGGALLLTPGFFTDALGLALMLPPVRMAHSLAAQRAFRSCRPGAPRATGPTSSTAPSRRSRSNRVRGRRAAGTVRLDPALSARALAAMPRQNECGSERRWPRMATGTAARRAARQRAVTASQPRRRRSGCRFWDSSPGT
jgi:UPF0716 family protein affecting phage T7 exclusion